MEQEKEAVFEDCNRLEDENSNLKQDLYNAKRQLDELSRKNAGGLVDENSKRLLSRLKTIPTTCQDVVKVLEAAFPDRIVFTSRAYKSLDDCVTTPKLLWELLYGMATDFYDLLQTKPISAGEDFARNSGFEYSRNAGSMTRKSGKLMRNYEDSFEGKSINIEKHFKKGNKDSDPQSIRVYFEWNPEISYKIIIGHCGKHIDNWSSRGIH